MANKAISELPQAQNVNNQDLFVLEQSGVAKKLTAETFITEQGIIDALAEALDGHGGIQSVTLSSVSGRIRTYLITFTDGSTTTFQVLDGTSIDRIEKTSTAGLTDTYTIFMSDGTTTFFTVRNGEGFATYVRPSYSALMDEITAVKTYPAHAGRTVAVNKNHVTVTRTAAGTTYALMSLIGSGTSYQVSNISSAKVKALYDAGEFLPRDHYLYNLPDSNKKWYFNVSFFRPAGSGEEASIYLTAYDTVNESHRYLASISVTSSFAYNENASSYLVDFSTLTENEVIMVLYYKRSGTTTYRGVAAEWDWSLESARGIIEDQGRQDSNLAWVESTNTASRAYAVGDYVTIGGELCRITAAVASGGTLISGTNYTVVTGGLANDLLARINL